MQFLPRLLKPIIKKFSFKIEVVSCEIVININDNSVVICIVNQGIIKEA
jgi:hypothetical protein